MCTISEHYSRWNKKKNIIEYRGKSFDSYQVVNNSLANKIGYVVFKQWSHECLMKNSKHIVLDNSQGRIQDFHGGGGGGQNIMFAHPHHERESRSPLRAWSARLRALEAVGF